MLFNYSDGGEGGSPQPALFWFARRTHDPSLLYTQARYFPEKHDEAKDPALRDRETSRFLPLALLWWPEPGAFSAEPAQPRYWQGRGSNPLAIFRSSWTDPNALYLALKGGSASLNHAHMDAGSFVFESDGVRWACDLGAQSYDSLESKNIDLWNKSQDSQRWSVFRLNNHSHNTLTIDGQLHRVAGSAQIVAFSNNATTPFAVLDLTSVFAGQATAVKRGFRLVGERSVLIQDELTGVKAGATVRWAMVTDTDVSVDGATATLRDHVHVLHAQLLAPAGAKFSVIPADPPKNDYDAPNPGRRILIATVPAGAGGTVRIAVWLKPSSAADLAEPKLVSLTEWPDVKPN